MNELIEKQFEALDELKERVEMDFKRVDNIYCEKAIVDEKVKDLEIHIIRVNENA